ncbi:MAG: dockerin type I domain-containing protein, partial [Planctomycetota bacterium]
MTRSRQLATLFGIAAATLTASAAFAQPQISSTDLPSDGWYTDPAGFSTFSVRFSEDVLVPAHDAVRVRSTLSGEVLDTSYSYDALSRSLQVTVDSSSSLFVQRLLISIDYSITSAESGLALDGEIQSLQNPAFPSGNGKPGGRAVFVLNVLPGDANRDGRVDIADENALLESLGTASGDPGFDPMADMNRDGFVNAIDVVAVIRNQGESIQLSTTDANVVELLPDPDIPLNADVNEVRFAIAVAVQPDSVDARALFVTDLDGAVRPADSVQLSPDNSTLIFGFDPPLEQCSQNTLGLAPSFLGSAGELASPGVTAVLSGIEPLGDPILDPIERSTTSRSVTISGFATNATTVEISGPGGVFTVQANNGNFGADVDLDTNRLNRIFVTPISSCGVRGLARTVEVIQDETPPNVFIDLPVQGQQIQAPATDVAGRVGDLLSGFDGLTVLVNGIEAEVDIGIGTNGTFFLPSLPLDPDTNTEITVEASDTLGNRRSQSITVQRIEVPENAPRFSLSENAGNNQQAPVLTELSEPIRVRLIDANGAPLADKLVSFTVLRSDGMISKSAGSEKERIQQVRTDASGFASVYWTLGNDAGCGNNRLGVTSTDVAGTVLFCASALPGPTNQINIGSGNNQRGELGAPLADALRAWVSDACNGIEGIPVTFEIVRGDGLLNGDPVSTTIITGPTGHAEAEFTFGTTPGNNIIRADYPGNPTGPAEFVVFGLERDPSRPTIFTGVVQNNSSQPIADAEIELELNGEIVAFALSDEDGRFSLTGFP